MPVRVVHCRFYEASDPKPPGTYIFAGRPSKWGNPWRLGVHGDRAMVIQHFRTWWYDEINAPMRQAALEEIPDDALLGCFCAPKACHCDVIAEFLNRERKVA